MSNLTLVDEREYNIKEDWDLRALDHPLSKYTPAQKIQAVATYVMTGNVTRAAESINAPRVTVQRWKGNSDWWNDTLVKIRKEKQDSLDAVITDTINTALETVRDRIEFGDYKMRSGGELVRVPMSGKELTVTLAVLYDKRALIRGEATAITARRTSSLGEIESKLKEFAKFNSAKTIDLTSKTKRV